MNGEQNNETVYLVTIEDLQNEAVAQIGRKLTDDELRVAEKGVKWGLSSMIGITMKSAIDESIALNH